MLMRDAEVEDQAPAASLVSQVVIIMIQDDSNFLLVVSRLSV
jgi:hypothetical protein